MKALTKKEVVELVVKKVKLMADTIELYHWQVSLESIIKLGALVDIDIKQDEESPLLFNVKEVE
jgi:hypothetical protein